MSVFEVLGPIPDDVDRVVAAADTILWRHEGRVHLAMLSASASLLREAALAGLRLRPVAIGLVERPPSTAEAQGRDLRPIPCDDTTVDRIELGVVPLAEATRALLRRPFRIVPLGSGRRERCRELLRGEDVAYRASRVVWCPRAALRDVTFRRSLRPVVFDRGATAPEMPGTARSGDLTRWLRG